MQSFFLSFCHDFTMICSCFCQDEAPPPHHLRCTSAESSAVTAQYPVFFSTKKTKQGAVHNMQFLRMLPRKFSTAGSSFAPFSPLKNKEEYTKPSALPVSPPLINAFQKTGKSKKETFPQRNSKQPAAKEPYCISSGSFLGMSFFCIIFFDFFHSLFHTRPPTVCSTVILCGKANYNSQLLTVLGNGMTSRIFAIPVRYITQRSNPSPNPACLAEPYLRRSR